MDLENDSDEDISMLVDDDDAPDLSGSEKVGVLVGDYNQGKPSGLNGGEATEASWAIVAVVKKKITFSKRPMPITNKATR
jgi:hypothetical protein